MKEYDLVIVGAGFSGLACAKVAANSNLNTLVLEKKYDVGVDIHTTGILVKEIAEEWNVPERLVRRINGVRLYSPSLDWFDLTSPDYYFLATDTPNLLRWHAQQASLAGATIHINSKYNGSEFDNKQHHFNKQRIKSRYLVGCDGPRSRVARHYNLGINQQVLAGIEAEYDEISDLDKDKLHVFIDSDIAPGYIAWIVPGVNCTQIGLASRYKKAPQLKKFIDELSPLVDLSHINLRSHRAGLIPCGGIVKYYSNENVLLLGDAAGMVSPLTAGGIHLAIQIGGIAGSAISEYLHDQGPPPGHYLDKSIPSFVYKKLLRRITDQFTLPNWVSNYLLKTPVFRSIASTVFFHHRGLLSLTAWRDLVRILSN